MKSNPVTVTLTMEQEFDLMNRYGRRCSREGLVTRAIADAVKGSAKEPKEKKPRKPREKKEKVNGLDTQATSTASGTTEQQG